MAVKGLPTGVIVNSQGSWSFDFYNKSAFWYKGLTRKDSGREGT